VKRPHYNINVVWSGEDGCWIADVPDLRLCSAHGETPEEAAACIQDAIKAWLEVARKIAFAITEPRYRPAIYAARDAV
jgi:predicted RNase H-like HicB family nuclease